MPLAFPGSDWESIAPADAGMREGGLESAVSLLAGEAGEAPWHLHITRFGRVVLDRHREGHNPARVWPVASLGKSLVVSMLGIAIAEGKIRSADDRLLDYYPEIVGAAGEGGPYPDGGRFFSEDDRAVTLRQLATHTGGFMRPNEPPGAKWTYDTFGMATLMHAIAKQYGFYDPADPKPERGDGELVAEKIRDPIGAGWDWNWTNFTNHPPTSRIELFSNYVTFAKETRRDMARLGLLWMAGGRWGDREVIPGGWHRESVRVAPAIEACAPREQWVYGQGFWVNSAGVLWPDLPGDSFLAGGFPNHLLWMCPSLSLVVTMHPGLPPQKRFEQTVADAARLLLPIVEAVS